MAHAQLIQGNSTELLSYLTRHPHQQDLLLIVPDKVSEPTDGYTEPQEEAMPDGTIFRNGVPLFPMQDGRQPVTMELVQRLMEED